MAGRIRSLRPELLDDEVMASLSSDAWRIAVALVLLADDHGNVRFGEKYVGANVFQDTSKDVSAACDELVTRGIVRPYAVDGQRYASIHGWREEDGRFRQRLDNASKTKRVPGPEKDDGTCKRVVTPNLAETRGDSPNLAEVRASRARAPITISDHEHEHEHEHAAPAAVGAGAPSPPSELRLIPEEPEAKSGGPAERIFNAYKRARLRWNPKTQQDRLVLSKKARSAITARMREGHTEATLSLAAQGIFLDTWEGRASQVDFHLAMRDTNVVRFAEMAENDPSIKWAHLPPLDDIDSPKEHGPVATPEEIAAIVAANLPKGAPSEGPFSKVLGRVLRGSRETTLEALEALEEVGADVYLVPKHKRAQSAEATVNRDALAKILGEAFAPETKEASNG